LPRPFKTGRTMAYYDRTHLDRLKRISRIRPRLMKKHGRSRVSLESIRLELADGSSSLRGPAGRSLTGKSSGGSSSSRRP